MKNFKKYYNISASPEEVYQALTNPISMEIWTGEDVEMSTEPGSEFSMWDGSIVGKNIEFVENKKIVQQWYFGDQVEESLVTIILHEDKHGTSAELRHTNIPDSDFEDIVEGWDTAYFGSVIDFFDGL
jgi:uncharacterized protein YndB with AHSA1/START domain